VREHAYRLERNQRGEKGHEQPEPVRTQHTDGVPRDLRPAHV
jgi:hypothetical protein